MNPTGDLTFDTNGDGSVTIADHQHWVEDPAYANSVLGDADLDGSVDFPDFLALSAGFGQSGGWAEGDFDASGAVEFPDFLILAENFGQVAASTASVPEPSVLLPFTVGFVILVHGRHQRRSRKMLNKLP